jgi:hypothetical protein
LISGVLWCYENGTKVPYQVSGGKASSTNPATWDTFEAVYAAWQKHPKRWSGIGFVFCEIDPFAGIDLDNCLDDTNEMPKVWCRGLIERFSDTYMEISPSGLGVKIWCRGQLPAAVPKVLVEDGGIEMYDRGRYFTVTGRAFRGAPLEIEDHAADILAQYERLTGHRGIQYGIPQDGRILHGIQHLTLVSLAGTLRRRGVCEEAIEACLQAVNVHQCEQPGRPGNISQLVRSTRRWMRP